jgi:hypothetical protein
MEPIREAWRNKRKGKTGFQRPKMKETKNVCNQGNMLETFLMEGSNFRSDLLIV